MLHAVLFPFYHALRGFDLEINQFKPFVFTYEETEAQIVIMTYPEAGAQRAFSALLPQDNVQPTAETE